MNRVRKIIHCEYAHNQKIFGDDVGVAILDTGISLHPDLYHRVHAFKDFVHYMPAPYDDNSHGTHVAYG